MTIATLYAPEVDGLLRIRNTNAPDLILPLDMRAQTLLALLHNIVPHHGTRRLWITSERGPIEAFGTYETLHRDGAFDTYAQFKEHWLSCYPHALQWYSLSYTEQNGDHLLTVNERFTVRFADDAPETDNPMFVLQLMAWLIAGVEECVRRCAQGTYNEWVKSQLPFDMRMGIMPRKTYWEIVPESRAYVQAIVQKDELERFDRLFVRPPLEAPDRRNIEYRLPALSLNDYYRACTDAYIAARLPPPSESAAPVDWHMAYANPRGQTADMLDRDSPEEFLSWVEDGRGNRYVWEMLPGPGFSWVTLTPMHDERGWILVLDGATYPLCANAINAALALHDAGWPIRVPQAGAMLRAVRGEDHVGVVPRYVMPPYDNIRFPDCDVHDFVTLTVEHEKEMIAQTSWYPIVQVRLFDSTVHDSADAIASSSQSRLETNRRETINHGRIGIDR